jgi:anti-sigma regulatory factor (Ser/Thr protein kinase)
MKSGRRPLVLVAAIILLLGAVALGLAVIMLVAAPVALVAEIAVLGLVIGLVARVRHRPPRQHGPDVLTDQPVDIDDTGSRESLQGSPHPCWAMDWESGPPASAVPLVRDGLSVALAEWGLAGERVEPVMLVVTELMSNAVEHARPPVRLAVVFSGLLRVEVRDAATRVPQLGPVDPWRVRGRGLQLVEALSMRWGWTDDTAGKIVWAEVPTEWRR